MYAGEAPKARPGASSRPWELHRPSRECLRVSECISISVVHTSVCLWYRPQAHTNHMILSIPSTSGPSPHRALRQWSHQQMAFSAPRMASVSTGLQPSTPRLSALFYSARAFGAGGVPGDFCSHDSIFVSYIYVTLSLTDSTGQYSHLN